MIEFLDIAIIAAGLIAATYCGVRYGRHLGFQLGFYRGYRKGRSDTPKPFYVRKLSPMPSRNEVLNALRDHGTH